MYAPSDGEFIGFLLITMLVVAGVGWGLNELAEWAWPFIKAWLHAVTA